ncbi:hypothetical protein C4556_00505 [Candidatus Parcubacteria bacterium]|nr:MAG: hypothetical protein C4556_00505 [Candidatus Parcubacteria bacterium]
MKEGVDPIKAGIRQSFLEKVRKTSLNSFRSSLFDSGGRITETLPIGEDGYIQFDPDSRTADMLLCALKGEGSRTAEQTDARHTAKDVHDAAEAISRAYDILFEFDEDAKHITYTATLLKRQDEKKNEYSEGGM